MGIDGPCFILPPQAATARAYVCIPVAEEVASRSSVMDTLMNSEGIATFPDDVTVSDYFAWSALRPNGHVEELSADDALLALRVRSHHCMATTICTRIIHLPLCFNSGVCDLLSSLAGKRRSGRHQRKGVGESRGKNAMASEVE